MIEPELIKWPNWFQFRKYDNSNSIWLGGLLDFWIQFRFGARTELIQKSSTTSQTTKPRLIPQPTNWPWIQIIQQSLNQIPLNQSISIHEMVDFRIDLNELRINEFIIGQFGCGYHSILMLAAIWLMISVCWFLNLLSRSIPESKSTSNQQSKWNAAEWNG